MAVSALLEGLQALTPDRSSNLPAAVCGAGGARAAAWLAELSTRARKRRAGSESPIKWRSRLRVFQAAKPTGGAILLSPPCRLPEPISTMLGCNLTRPRGLGQ